MFEHTVCRNAWIHTTLLAALRTDQQRTDQQRTDVVCFFLFCLVQAMLGLYPYALLKILLVNTHLPAWVPQLQINNLRVGDGSVSIRFFRSWPHTAGRGNGLTTFG